MTELTPSDMDPKKIAPPEYDAIGAEYSKVNGVRPLIKYAVYPSFFDQIGDVKGLDALDLACGDGLITRQLKSMGADAVAGIDLSATMIGLAKEKEQQEPRDIEYRVGKVGEIGQIGQFDLITAAFLLHYAETQEELARMCQDIYTNLKPGGRFITINNNSESPLSDHVDYGNLIKADRLPLQEGDPLHVIILGDDGSKVQFTNYYWQKQTYIDTLDKAGFSFVNWLPIRVTEEGMREMGKEYWRAFEDKPFFTLIEALK